MASRLLRTAQQSYQRLPQWSGSEKYQTSTNTLQVKKARIPLLLAFAASVLLYLFSKSGSAQEKSSYTSVQEWAREEGGRALLDATFEERIASWNATPTQNTSDFMMLNLGNCPASKSRGGFRHWYFGDEWKDTLKDPNFISTTRNAAIDHLLEHNRNGSFSPELYGEGRGLVIVAGNTNTFNLAHSSIRLLRERFYSEIPVEIWSYPSEAPPEDFVAWGSVRNVVFRQVEEDIDHDLKLKDYNWRYRIKTIALIQSSFREVLMLDSDAFALMDPLAEEGVFNAPSYKKHGFMLWPNIWDLWAEMPLWQIIGVPCRSEWMIDSAVLLVDKARHLDTLYLSLYIQSAGGIWNTLTYGDCDSFRFALLALRKRWAIPGRQAGLSSWINIPQFCGHTLLHFDHFGEPAFIHALSVKGFKAAQISTFTAGPKGDVWGISRTGPIGHINGTVEADHMVNVDMYGNAELAHPDMRRRAALERGMTYRYGGGLPPPRHRFQNCLHLDWKDHRTAEEKEMAKWISINQKKQAEGNFSEHTTEGFNGSSEAWKYQWDTLMWEDHERLKDFEEGYWRVGGVL